LGCPFREVTGYLCPGCGIQRAFHELLHFHFFKAFQLNGLFVLGIPYVLVLIFTGFQKEKFQNIRSFLLSPRTLWVLLMISILFGIIRNL
jgi:hypothetical protein